MVCGSRRHNAHLIASDASLVAKSSVLCQPIARSSSTLTQFTQGCQYFNLIFKFQLTLKLKTQILAVLREIRTDNVKGVFDLRKKWVNLDVLQCYFIRLKPSTIATACIIAAIKGLKFKIDCRALRSVCALTNSSVELVKDMVGRLEWMVAKEEASVYENETSMKMAPVNCASASGFDKMDVDSKMIPNVADLEETQQLTPTDVQDVEF
ncbi:hypothetical protein V9T40_012576 [Parthenolecanium corni]|uniref:Cyclin C-terminal domain-containing protein n=1 Tax=Parthenolecanium corni TaxID=536013 RepID=A0AAN9T807_9HEMI